MTAMLFWPNWLVLLFAVTPLTKADPFAVALTTLWSWVRFCVAFTVVP